MTRSLGRLHVTYMEPDLGDDDERYLTASVELPNSPVWVHVSASTRGAGPRITHGGFTGRLVRAIIDLPVSVGVTPAELRAEGGDLVTVPGGPHGRAVARRLILTWEGLRAQADDAELLATSRRAQDIVKALLRWATAGRPSEKEERIAMIVEEARRRGRAATLQGTAQTLGRAGRWGEPQSDFKRDVKDAGGWLAIKKRAGL